jgi:hypothetical protein
MSARPTVPTFTKLKNGQWGVRWPLEFGDPPEKGAVVEVHKKNGKTTEATIDTLMITYADEAVVFSIVQKEDGVKQSPASISQQGWALLKALDLCDDAGELTPAGAKLLAELGEAK